MEFEVIENRRVFKAFVKSECDEYLDGGFE